MRIPDTLRERLVVTADDFGVRETAAAILPLAQAGQVDRVAVLVRSCTPADARALLATGVKIDIHLDLIRLLRRGETPGDATMCRVFRFLLRFCSGSLRSAAVAAEWRSQMNRFQELFGRLPDGVNSHEHVHYFPTLFPIILTLAGEYRIPYLRFGGEGTLPSFHRSHIGRLLHFLIRMNRTRFRSSALASTEYLLSLDWLLRAGTETLSLPQGSTSVELVVHPERLAEARTVATFPSL
jgi:predicted glycoside hydrolase/deacetylase ChbG (UPF0249 family)